VPCELTTGGVLVGEEVKLNAEVQFVKQAVAAETVNA